jgi:hypothetical protein
MESFLSASLDGSIRMYETKTASWFTLSQAMKVLLIVLPLMPKEICGKRRSRFKDLSLELDKKNCC